MLRDCWPHWQASRPQHIRGQRQAVRVRALVWRRCTTKSLRLLTVRLFKLSGNLSPPVINLTTTVLTPDKTKLNLHAPVAAEHRVATVVRVSGFAAAVTLFYLECKRV